MFDYDSIDIVSEHLLDIIPKHIWERGYAYFQNGAVTDVRTTDSVVTASVQGTSWYSVKLTLRSFRVQASCSCPQEHGCKHIAAVFLHVYESVVGDSIEFMKAQVFGGESVPFLRNIAQRSTKKSSNAPVAMPDEDGGLEQWTAYIEAIYGNVSKRFYQLEYYYDLRSEFILPFYPVTQSWQPGNRVLYRLYAVCVLIHRVFAELTANEDAVTRRRGEFRSDIAVRLLEDAFRELMRLYDEAARFQVAPTWLSEPRLWDVAAYLRVCLSESRALNVASVLAYQLLWMHIAHGDDRTPNEIQHLLSRLRDMNPDTPGAEALQLALVTLLVLANQDKQARLIADAVVSLDTEDVLALTVAYVADLEEWPRVIEWLRFITDHLHQFGPDNIRRFTAYWMRVRQHLSVDDEVEVFLRKGLPVTKHGYEAFLYESGRMRRWVELQILHCVDPVEYRADVLKVVESSDREALLPWYHQSIERAVRLKNRKSYKLAARMLKKLSTHYKKLKRVDDWERFMNQFTARHARLRALQEEMRKKGLIS